MENFCFRLPNWNKMRYLFIDRPKINFATELMSIFVNFSLINWLKIFYWVQIKALWISVYPVIPRCARVWKTSFYETRSMTFLHCLFLMTFSCLTSSLWKSFHGRKCSLNTSWIDFNVVRNQKRINSLTDDVLWPIYNFCTSIYWWLYHKWGLASFFNHHLLKPSESLRVSTASED